MSLETEDVRPKAESASEPVPLIDFYSFHQGSISMSDNNAARKQPGSTSIELSDPFAFHQGLSALSNTLNKQTQSGDASRSSDAKKEEGSGGAAAPADKTTKAPGGKPDNYICVDGFCRPMTQAEIDAEGKNRNNKPASALDALINNPFKFHQNDKTPAGPSDRPALPVPPKDQPAQPAQPGDRTTDNPVPPNIPGSPVGKSPIVEAYERRQGARIAGSNPLPPIDAIPDNLRPPNPGGDLRPPQPNPGRPWDAPKPSDVTPWVPPRRDPDVKPADFRPADNTPDPSDARVKHVNNMDQFEQEVLNSKVPVIVDFYATWCGPCKQLAPNLEQTAKDYGGKVKVIKIDAERASEIASKYSIGSYPTMITFKGGQQVERMSGYRSTGQLHNIADKLLR